MTNLCGVSHGQMAKVEVERLSEKVLSGVSIAHLAGTQRQNQGCFVSFLDS
jgi:hypothetical protein